MPLGKFNSLFVEATQDSTVRKTNKPNLVVSIIARRKLFELPTQLTLVSTRSCPAEIAIYDTPASRLAHNQDTQESTHSSVLGTLKLGSHYLIRRQLNP